ncbi:MAG: dTMP kinase [Clostridiales bacterium]|nr:dTMP kinase [Clostridiales bacterium]
MKGRLITFEGGEGCGKTTQARRLAARLEREGLPFLLQREPGGTPLGETVRSLILQGDHPLAPWAEALLIAAARAQMVDEVLRPALSRGLWVVCDRFADSSTAYQGGGLGLGEERIEELNRWITGGLRPDLTFFLDLPPEEARHDRDKPLDRIERRPLDFHRRVYETYQRLAQREPDRIIRIDARKPPDVIEEEVWRAVKKLLPGGRRV